MIRTLITASFCLAIAAPVAAQKMGGANRNAPVCSQAIKFHSGASLHIEYTASTWGAGDWIKSEAMRNHIRQAASKSPIGKVKVHGTVTLGGKKVPEGEYKLYFTPGDDEGQWTMHCDAMKGDASVEWDLSMDKAEKMAKRLSIVVTAGEAANEAHVSLAFGKMTAKVKASPAKGEDKG